MKNISMIRAHCTADRESQSVSCLFEMGDRRSVYVIRDGFDIIRDILLVILFIAIIVGIALGLWYLADILDVLHKIYKGLKPVIPCIASEFCPAPIA